jgi:hypothetical protein
MEVLKPEIQRRKLEAADSTISLQSQVADTASIYFRRYRTTRIHLDQYIRSCTVTSLRGLIKSGMHIISLTNISPLWRSSLSSGA